MNTSSHRPRSSARQPGPARREPRAPRLARRLPALALLALLAGCGDGDRGAPDDGPLVTVVPPAQKAYAVALGRQTLETYFAEGREAALAGGPPPAAGEADVEVPRVFVTLRSGGVLRASWGAYEGPFPDLVREAVVRAAEDDRFGGPLRADELDAVVLELDAILDAEPLSERSLSGLTDAIEPGRHAFEFVHEDGRAFFKETVLVTHDWTHAYGFAELCRKAGLAGDCWSWASTAISRFRAEHWLEAPDEPSGFRELYRTHRIVTPADVTPDAVRAAARLNAGYLRTHQLADGGFDYLYAPEDDDLADSQYTVRQAGACYAAARAATFFGDEPELAETARRCAAWLLAHEAANEAGVPYIEWEGRSLGLTALTLLALAELRSTEEFREAAYRLADGIAAQQLPSGFFDAAYVGDEETDAQQFFPGEALLALARLAARYDEARWDPVFEKAFAAYVPFWEERGKSAFVPWHAAAWANHFERSGDRRHLDFAFELVDGRVARQERAAYGTWRRDDWGGALFVPSSGQPTAATGSSLEPLPLLVRLAREVGDDERADRYGDALRHGLRFVLQLVITDDETFFLPAPERALGGVRMSLADVHVRVDNVQHVMTAFLHALIETPDDPAVWGRAE